MKILTDCSFFSKRHIEKIEERYDAKYVLETQLKLRSDRWSDFSAAVFYAAESLPKGSNWFGIWNNDGRWMISNAISAVEESFFGVVAENGDVIYSRHPRDFRESADKTVFVDGGRERPRHDLMHEIVRLNVFKDRVVVIPRESEKPACEIPFTEELGWDLDVSELLTTEVLPEFAV